MSSRKETPYRITAVGLLRPLTEPCLHLSMYTALHYHLIQQNSMSVNIMVTLSANHNGFSLLSYHHSFPVDFPFKVLHFIDMMNFIMFAFCAPADFT